MTTPFDKMLEGAIAFRDSFVGYVKEELLDNEAIIIDMNVEDQLFEKGITSNNVRIDSYAPYAPLTLAIKKAKNQPTSRVTLRDEGDFHSSFYLEFTDDSFTIKASDEKAEYLEFAYGSDIFGLTPENREELTEYYLRPALLAKLKEHLGI